MTNQELEQYKQYLEMKAQSAEKAADVFGRSTIDGVLAIAKANGLREALQGLTSGSVQNATK